MIDQMSKVVTRLEQRIHDAAETKAEAKVQEVERAFEGLAKVFDSCLRTKAVRARAMVDLKHALIEHYSGEMAEAVVARLIEPPAAS